MTSSTKIVMDTCSLIDLFKYYQFDRDYGESETYSKLMEFINSKISSKEIVVIDKVFDELYGEEPHIKLFKKIVEKKTESTTSLLNKVKSTCTQFLDRINENAKKFTDINVAMLGQKLDEYENKNADLYLIEYCAKLKTENVNSILITEESYKGDKLLPKIPILCRERGLICKDLPYLLFNHYKEELKFSLNTEKD